MEQIIDKLIEEMDSLAATEDFRNVMDLGASCHFDDPGLVMHNEYPYMYVAPLVDAPKGETVGRTGYDIRIMTLQIGVVVDVADFFDATVSELPATRELVQVSALIRKRLRRLGKRTLDDLSGVRNVSVEQTNYVPDLRENTFVRVAVTTITVERQYQHEE